MFVVNLFCQLFEKEMPAAWHNAA